MGEFERRELRDFEAEEEEAEETFQLQVQDSLAQAQRERDEAMTLANSLRVCLDAAEAERTSLHARLAVAEPKAAALDALECEIIETYVDFGPEGPGPVVGYSAQRAWPVVRVEADTLLALGTALAAQAATGEGTQIEEVTDDES